MPEDHADCDADVEGVFGAALGYLQGEVGGVDDVLADALHFIAVEGENNSIYLDQSLFLKDLISHIYTAG